MKKRILIFSTFFLPGFKGGGPIRTIANLLCALGGEFEFFLVTSDRDLGDAASYSGLRVNRWLRFYRSCVIYLSPSWFLRGVGSIISRRHWDVLQLNSFFSFRFSILPLFIWLFCCPRLPVILGPRGEFSPGALSQKVFKKKAYIFLSKILGINKRVIWLASTCYEAADIRRVMGDQVIVHIAVDIARVSGDIQLESVKEDGVLRVVFLSRISPIKNIKAAIDVLSKVVSNVVFDIYGPVEDDAYWSECQRLSAKLPANVIFRYQGALNPDRVGFVLARYDLFFLPTLGENFGHVIAEALSVGLPVLISDRTPWRNLEVNELGWDLPLDALDGFSACLDFCCRMKSEDYQKWRERIRAWAANNIGSHDAIQQNRILYLDFEKNEKLSK